MKIRHFLLLVVVLVSFVPIGCTPVRSGTEYLSVGGRGEVRGEMSGVEFCAVISIAPAGESVRVEYLSPSSLCGLIFTAEGEECEVSVGEMCFACNTSEVFGLLRPATAFLVSEDAASVQKSGQNTILTFSNGTALTLSSQGEPLSLEGEDIQMRMVWWESKKVKSEE